MENPIGQELSEILSDLDRISDLVAQKESELGFVHTLDLAAIENDCYALHIDDRTYYLDGAQLALLADRIAALRGAV